MRLDAYDGPAGAASSTASAATPHVGGKSYRGVPLLYFELMTGAAE